jgi:hypothetical protein
MATFFFDNDISFRIVRALSQLVDPSHHELLALRDRFPVNTRDTDWIPEAGANGWIVVSRDHNQRRRDAERRALQEHNVRALYIRQSGNALELYADAARIIRCWPKIRDWGNAAGPGALVKLDTADRIVELET